MKITFVVFCIILVNGRCANKAGKTDGETCSTLDDQSAIKECLEATQNLKKYPTDSVKVMSFMKHCRKFLDQIKLSKGQQQILHKIGYDFGQMPHVSKNEAIRSEIDAQDSSVTEKQKESKDSLKENAKSQILPNTKGENENSVNKITDADMTEIQKDINTESTEFKAKVQTILEKPEKNSEKKMSYDTKDEVRTREIDIQDNSLTDKQRETKSLQNTKPESQVLSSTEKKDISHADKKNKQKDEKMKSKSTEFGEKSQETREKFKTKSEDKKFQKRKNKEVRASKTNTRNKSFDEKGKESEHDSQEEKNKSKTSPFKREEDKKDVEDTIYAGKKKQKDEKRKLEKINLMEKASKIVEKSEIEPENNTHFLKNEEAMVSQTHTQHNTLKVDKTKTKGDSHEKNEHQILVTSELENKKGVEYTIDAEKKKQAIENIMLIMQKLKETLKKVTDKCKGKSEGECQNPNDNAEGGNNEKEEILSQQTKTEIKDHTPEISFQEFEGKFGEMESNVDDLLNPQVNIPDSNRPSQPQEGIPYAEIFQGEFLPQSDINPQYPDHQGIPQFTSSEFDENFLNPIFDQYAQAPPQQGAEIFDPELEQEVLEPSPIDWEKFFEDEVLAPRTLEGSQFHSDIPDLHEMNENALNVSPEDGSDQKEQSATEQAADQVKHTSSESEKDSKEKNARSHPDEL